MSGFLTTNDPLELPLEGPLLIEASAGTGKTYTITTLVLRLLLEAKLEISSLLVLTYTRAATAELRDRIRRRIAEAQRALEHPAPPNDDTLARIWHARATTRESDAKRLGAALRDFDRAPIFTIHGFCQRVLGEHALESKLPFDVTLLEDTSVLIDDAVHDFLVSHVDGLDPRLYGAQMRAGLKVESLTKLARLIVGDPQMPVLPERVDHAIDSSAFDAADKAISRVAAGWHRHKREVLELICNEVVLNKQSFNTARIQDKWVPKLDQLEELSYGDAQEWVERLTQEKVSKSTKKEFKHRAPEHPFFRLCSDALVVIERAQEQASQAALVAKLALVERARKDVSAAKRHAGAQSFDDLLHGLLSALRDPNGQALARTIARRYPVLLVDEFQDTDPVQLEIFRRMHDAGGKLLAFVGDPKQAIYGFRGADVFVYLAASKQLADQGGKRLSLAVSRRSDPSLVAAINFVFARVEQPFGKQPIEYPQLAAAAGARNRLRSNLPALQLLFLPRTGEASEDGDEETEEKGFADQNALPELMADEIVKLLQSGTHIDDERDGWREVEPRDLAVLCRTNKQGLEVQKALSARGVPAALDGDSTVIESPTSNELARVLRAMVEPSDRALVASALATRLMGGTASDLHALRADDRAFERWLELFARVCQIWQERGFVQAAHVWLAEARVRPRLLTRADGARELTNLLHLIELLHLEAMRDHLGPLALVQRFEALRASPKQSGGMGAESTQLRLESDERAVRITTVHRSKGLEYPIVFCPYAWTRPFFSSDVAQFHDPDDEQRMKLDLGSERLAEHKKLADDEAISDSLRLAYVALTRAKHRIYAVIGGFRDLKQGALGRLLFGAGGGLPNLAFGNKTTDADLLAHLQRLVAASNGALGLRVLPIRIASEAPRYVPRALELLPLEARVLRRELGSGERLSSFSRITRSAHKVEATAVLAEGEDLLASVSDDESDAGDAGDAREGSETGEPRAIDTAIAEPAALASPVVLHDFPAGPGPGTLLHAIYEHIDFEQAAREGDASLRTEVERWLGRGRIDVTRFAEPLERGIRQSLLAPLDTGDRSLTLSSVSKRDRLDELEFTLPLREGTRVSPSTLAGVLAANASPSVGASYPRKLAELGERRLRGYLRGFIDLVFRKDGRFYLLDYKSNHLGTAASDYAQPKLAQVMEQHHYYLQYHLYALALHRYLRSRLPEYDYERCFGGVLYAFVRGMAPEHAPGHGVFVDRPSLAMITALDALFGAAVPTPTPTPTKEQA